MLVGREERVKASLSAAAGPPYALAVLMGEVADLGCEVVFGGRRSVRGDATAAVLLAESACAGAGKLVSLNLERIDNDERLEQSRQLARATREARELVLARH